MYDVNNSFMSIILSGNYGIIQAQIIKELFRMIIYLLFLLHFLHNNNRCLVNINALELHILHIKK